MDTPSHIKVYSQGFLDRITNKLYNSNAGWKKGSGTAYDTGWNAACHYLRGKTMKAKTDVLEDRMTRDQELARFCDLLTEKIVHECRRPNVVNHDPRGLSRGEIAACELTISAQLANGKRGTYCDALTATN